MNKGKITVIVRADLLIGFFLQDPALFGRRRNRMDDEVQRRKNKRINGMNTWDHKMVDLITCNSLLCGNTNTNIKLRSSER